MIKLFRDLIVDIEERLASGVSDERLAYCTEVRADKADAEGWELGKRPGEKQLAEPHFWAMQMAQQEIDWLCKDWQPERRDDCPEKEDQTRGCGYGEHAEKLTEILETYKEEAQCGDGRPDAVPCHEGTVAGIRPRCFCECEDWWEGEMCNIPICKPMTEIDFPFTDCGIEQDGCGGTVDFGPCETHVPPGSDLSHLPAHVSGPMAPVVRMMQQMIQAARESLKYGGDGTDKVRFCKQIEASFTGVRRDFKYSEAAPHKWAFKQIRDEITWLCRTDQGASVSARRQAIDEHIAAMGEVLKTYEETVVCGPGMSSCGAHGKVVGMRPACGCECPPGVTGEHCEEGEPTATTTVAFRSEPITTATSTTVANSTSSTDGRAPVFQFGAWARSSTSVRSRQGGDWTEVTCGEGQVVLGGGCKASTKPHKFEYNGPSEMNSWACGGFGGDKEVWAVCAKGDTLGSFVGLKEVEGGDWTTVSCDSGQVVTGGGCQALESPHKMEYNGPDRRSAWKCGGHGGRKKVWAICAPDDGSLTIKENPSGGDWTTVRCDAGQVVTGGGCKAFERPHKMEFNGPDGNNGWGCGGHGGKKQVWAICTTAR